MPDCILQCLNSFFVDVLSMSCHCSQRPQTPSVINRILLRDHKQICTSVWGGNPAILKTAKTQIPHGVREPKSKTQIVFILLPSPVSPDSPLTSLCVLNTKQAPTDIMTCTTIQRSHLTIWAYWPTSSHTRETNIDMLLSQHCYLTLDQLPYALISWTQLYVRITSCGLMQPKWALKLHWLKRQNQIYNNKTAKS